MQPKRNISLIVGISIPILMIVFVAAAIYIPGLFAKPKYDFLYISGANYCSTQYLIQSGKLVKNETKSEYCIPSQTESKLYVHDVAKNESREISFTNAQALTLNSDNESPDGFRVTYGSRGGDFFFFGGGRDYNAMYLQGQNASKKLNLKSTGTYYHDNFRFLGWIMK